MTKLPNFQQQCRKIPKRIFAKFKTFLPPSPTQALRSLHHQINYTLLPAKLQRALGSGSACRPSDLCHMPQHGHGQEAGRTVPRCRRLQRAVTLEGARRIALSRSLDDGDDSAAMSVRECHQPIGLHLRVIRLRSCGFTAKCSRREKQNSRRNGAADTETVLLTCIELRTSRWEDSAVGGRGAVARFNFQSNCERPSLLQVVFISMFAPSIC